jgi:hypothetical protein
LKASILTNRLTPGGASLLILTTGVLPTVSRMFWNLAMQVSSVYEAIVLHPGRDRRHHSTAEQVRLLLPRIVLRIDVDDIERARAAGRNIWFISSS